MAALLALGWNVGSLIILGTPPQAGAKWVEAVVTVSFSMLTLLPAVLMNVVLQGRRRFMVAAGYTVSVVATVLHASELFSLNMGLHQTALLLVAIGFGVLAIASFLLSGERRWRAKSRAESVSLAFLLLFTSSFLHFGYQHTSSPWAAEITWHHISRWR